MNTPHIAVLSLSLAYAAFGSHAAPVFAQSRGFGGVGGGQSSRYVGGIHPGGFRPGGMHVGRLPYGNYYGGGIYRGGVYGAGLGYGPGLGYGLGGYQIGGYGLNGYGFGGSYFHLDYSSPTMIYSGSPLLLAPSNPEAVQVISLYPPVENISQPLPKITTGRPVVQANDDTGSVVVRVPANAEVWWNGTRAMSSGKERIFGTLPLAPEGSVQRFEAKWADANGQMVNQVREVRALPNQAVVLDFTAPVQANERLNTPAASVPGEVPNLPPAPDPFK